MDESGNVVEGEGLSWVDEWKFINNEILCESQLQNLEFARQDEVEIPSRSGAFYTIYRGEGVQFECDGSRYNMSEDNKFVLLDLISQGKDIKWYWIRKEFLRHGGTTEISIKSNVLTSKGTEMPDIELVINRTI